MDERDEAARQRRNRNIALAVVLVGLVVLFFVMSIVQWSAHHAH
jgi:hypothetical protein